MPDYSKCVIYKITCNDTSINDTYVGSTCNFTRRKSQHKTSCNNVKTNGYNIPLYKFIRDNGGWSNWIMSPIKKYPCDDITDKLIEERRIMELLGATLNGYVPGRTRKEWYNVNKESINIKKKEKFNCACGGRYTRGKKSQHQKTKKHQNFIHEV